MRSLIIILSAALFVAAPASAREFATPNEQARFLAGLTLPNDSPLAAYTSDNAWQQHANELDQAWSRAEGRSLSKVRAWSATFVKSSGSSAPCFYMFSGPDILYARTIFPNSSTYVLCGIEPVGSVPDIAKMPRENIGPALNGLRRSLSNVLRFSYFITKDMRVDLSGSQLGGTVPVLCVFLARMGCTVEKIEYVSLNGAGALGSGGVRGVRIAFRGESGAQTLYYFDADLSNGGSGAAVMNFCRRQGASGLGLLKAASYLLHEGGFSKCRDFLLGSCRVIVQDDSGIPHRFFNPSRWQIRYFGRYVGTTGGPFAKHYQADLAAAYQQVNPVELDFQLSYQWNPKIANIQVAVPSGNVPPQKPEPTADAETGPPKKAVPTTGKKRGPR